MKVSLEALSGAQGVIRLIQFLMENSQLWNYNQLLVFATLQPCLPGCGI